MTELGETSSSKEIRPEISRRIEIAEKIIRGEYGQEFSAEEGMDLFETFSGPILDLNDESLSEKEKIFLENWIEKKLGARSEESPVRTNLKSSDGSTEVVVYDVELGDNWYLSKWQNQGEQPSYIFWPQDVYDWQLEAGYEEAKKNTA